MIVGLLREIRAGERRVALIPASVQRLTERGHRVIVEHAAGDQSHFPDGAYVAAGGQIAFTAAEVIDRSELLVKVERPTLDEFTQMHPYQAVMGFMHLAVARRGEITQALEKSITTIGCEIIETADGGLPVLEPMSELAGPMAIAIASHLLRSTSGGRGILLGGAPGIPPARVVILGAGVVGTWAARAALAAGASTQCFDIDLGKLRRLHLAAPGVITRLPDPSLLAEAVSGADVVIGAVLIRGERAPLLVTRAMVEAMRPGSVIVDVSIDQGGCVETSRPTTLNDPVFAHHGVLHYAVPNMTADISHTASMVISQLFLPYVLEIAEAGVEGALARQPDLARGVCTHAGHCTHAALAERWQFPYQELPALLGQERRVPA
jgi:alanine dehydrogenase